MIFWYFGFKFIFEETINNDIESLEDNIKIEIKNINYKSKMIDNYEIKKIKTNYLTPYKRIIKNDENKRTFKNLISSKKNTLKIQPINFNNFHNNIYNNSNLVHNQVDHNDHIKNLDKRVIKKCIKRVSGMYDTNNNNDNYNNNKSNNIENPLKNQILINKINEIKNNIKQRNNNFLNTGRLSPRNYMINNDNLKIDTQSMPKIIKTTN